jgi:hypothetical protein
VGCQRVYGKGGERVCQRVCEEGCLRVNTVQRRWEEGVPEGIEKEGRASATRGYRERVGRGVLEREGAQM